MLVGLADAVNDGENSITALPEYGPKAGREKKSSLHRLDDAGDLADDLSTFFALDGAGHIAALIVEPMTGSAGEFASPQGYLQRLREIPRAHGILLIFDEVITGFGRLDHAFPPSVTASSPT